MKKRKAILAGIIAALITVFVYTQVTLFSIQPIGALPEGRTIVIWRTSKLKFIDSADALCARETGGVNLLCRGAVLGAMAQNSAILMRLPYSETLYLISTGGSRYDR